MRKHKNHPSPERRVPIIEQEPRNPDCPTLRKRAFKSRRDAKAFLKRKRVIHGMESRRLSVYLCRCGAFHLGHTHPAGRAKNRKIAAGKVRFTAQVKAPASG